MTIEIPAPSTLSSRAMDKAPVFSPAEFTKGENNASAADSFGIAVDLGTTTIAIYLCNAAKREVIASMAMKNPQALYGDDTMSRIAFIGEETGNLERLQALVIRSIEWGMRSLLSRCRQALGLVSKMVCVGNPTMVHILAGVDPRPIGIPPYQPEFKDASSFIAGRLGFETIEGNVDTLPQVSGFIGGDILAGAQAVDFENQPDGTLLIDLGTNGELMLKTKNRIYAASCAIGPAFEGASLSCGMQAIAGAVNAVVIGADQKVSGFSVIGPEKGMKAKPAGLCGAGVISAVAQMFEKKIINPAGGFVSGKDRYDVIPANPDQDQSSVYISQKDIRSVQLGKSALISGIDLLLRKADLKKPVKIIIAGAFGSYLDRSDLLRIGMIPAIERDKIEAVGNAAGSGAVMALCDKRYIDQSIRMAAKIETIDLGSDSEFQDIFVHHLRFPESRQPISGQLI
ncbi:uncharacterized 2Fe-2S/4Fe-4S cluster protein (DUF4445 family) [Desulfosalsimonas propionicica]|uniref:Uncharacterized 2Fe-2S/4Fe-4S cluster protein (DUF4445 family) n=1 Tax=Desulfosalsimonas propionicica TaxID=332175 RepID=A0A7W0CBX5_9BACT|nr:ASKHA domain-containing protein [Desulfosalsimonas propionicica]MBA2882922.1 uncharacterized 2Fe-2S/4Fe-4S cluster protein (DUF4445 family) [Desulfosalsimonas propionicica]